MVQEVGRFREGKRQVSPKLVIGANGFLGSHVTRQLVGDGEEVRVTVRAGANTVSIDDLDVTRFVGDIFDTETIRAAMDGCDVVYYCVVDTRAWLRDPAPLFHTNVEGLRAVLEIAAEMSRRGVAEEVRVHQQLLDSRSQEGPGRHRGRRHRTAAS